MMLKFTVTLIEAITYNSLVIFKIFAARFSPKVQVPRTVRIRSYFTHGCHDGVGAGACMVPCTVLLMVFQ